MQKPQKPTVNKPSVKDNPNLSKPVNTNSYKSGLALIKEASDKIFGMFATRYKGIDDILTPAVDYAMGMYSTNVNNIGPPGCGKTSALKTIPNTWIPWLDKDKKEHPFNVLYVDTDLRAGVLAHKDTEKETIIQERTNWDVATIPADLDVVNQFLKHFDLIEAIRKRTIGRTLWDGRIGYDAIIYDSTTPMSMNLFNFIWRAVPDSNGEITWGTQYSKPSKDSKQPGNEERYGTLTHSEQAIILGLKNSADFFFCISHEKEPYFQDSGTKARYTADLAGGFKNMLSRLFQEVYFSVLHEKRYHWLTQFASQREARTQYKISKYIPQDYSIIINRRWDEFKVAETKIETEEEVAE